MPKRPTSRRRPARSKQRQRGKPPALASPLQLAPEFTSVSPVIKRLLAANPGSGAYKTMGGELGGLLKERVIKLIRSEAAYRLNWPPGLYIPAGANPADYWGTASPPAGNRYALAWTNGIGFSTASIADGSLHAVASSPTAKGAIDGKAEAGVGAIYTPKHTLVRLTLEPDLFCTGLFQWDVLADPVVLIRTRVVGSLLVGAYQSNPVTGGWEAMLNFTWRRHTLFSDAHEGSGKSAVTSVPFKATGAAGGISFNVSAGRSYLLAVVAQVALRVETLNSQGKPVNVTNGSFQTFGSVTGIVRQMWVDQQVLVN